MRALDAVCQVLADAGEPLHPREITQRVLSKGLWHTAGKTPEATITAQLALDIKKHGEASRFRRVSKGVYGLTGIVAVPTKAVAAPQSTGLGGGIKALSFLDAAQQVLDRFASGKPMHYRAITEKALALGLIATAGRTPEATMYTQVLTEIQRNMRRGERPRFVMHGKGFVGLARWVKRGLPFEIEQHNREVHKRLHEVVRNISPAEFEELIGRLLAALGFESVSVTAIGGDGGIDVRGILVVGDVVRIRMAVQVKRWKHNVQAPVVQQVRGSLGAHDHGLIITTSDFSPGALEEASRPNAVPVALMNGDQLVNLLIENNIGVRRTTHDLIELGEEEEP